MQQQFFKWGFEGYGFEILEVTPPEQLQEREQYYIDLMRPKLNSGRIACR